ncbi:hypothetical protein [Capnocytophaga sputigena]|uniref:Uncharacterized protein n=1 Tax=Capnocytophaga sputigena TaxID=1019 RepID=A0AAX2I8X2_CAPSP|nr:hypothetical protein [Capnocytophaga sputigena]SQA74846.1 Uncharacterised protein [Capnocytophaga sputigena]VEI53580.1 Uncharacterised protein [Capnocytophaga sputigena]
MKKLLFLLLLPCLSSFTEKNKQYQTEDFRMDIVLSTGEYYNLTSVRYNRTLIYSFVT